MCSGVELKVDVVSITFCFYLYCYILYADFITGTQKPWSVAWALWLAVFLISDWLSIAAVTKGTCPSSVPRDRPSSDSSSATYWTTTKAHPDGKRQVRGKISE
ncbi:putative transmembrane protein, partial [Toxoplasma gondii RUB]